ncbi:YihY/virulence factor BrkB family protein [Aquabacterium sp.]|uniref:YihY/virulence factor BrkB family protein n=1 Tax=Aquabacterium sp. TaxID=1872578 RepID=UPI003D6D94BE
MDTVAWPDRFWGLLPRVLRQPLQILFKAVSRWSEDRGPQLGAAIAFYTMFAVAPLLVVAIAIAGAVFGEDAARGQIVGEIEGLVGQAAAKSIEAMIESAWRHPNGLWASLLGVVTLLVGATGVFAELRRALNAIAHVVPGPSSALSTFVRARLIGFALVLGFGFLAIVSLLLSAVLAALGSYLAVRYPTLSELMGLVDVLVSTSVLVMAFAALLRWLPEHRPSRLAVWVGAVSSAVMFSVGKHLIGLYLVHASVASSYGAAGSFVVVMLWVYYSAQILLLGGALGAVVDEEYSPAAVAARGLPV